MTAVRIERERLAAVVLGAVAVVAAAVVRWHNIGDLSLWLDELTQVTVARGPLDQFLPSVRLHAAEAPLDLFGTWLGIEIFGFNTVFARIWAFATGVVAVIGVFGLALELAPRGRAALIAGVAGATLAVTSPILVYYAQEARPYSMSAAMTALLFWAFARYVRLATWRAWLVFTITAILAAYTHYYSALVLIASGGALVLVFAVRWLRAGRDPAIGRAAGMAIGRLILAAALIGAAFTPWYLLVTRQHLATTFDYPPVAPLTLESGFRMLQRLVTGAPIVLPDGGDPALDPIFTLALLGLAIVGAVATIRRRPAATIALGSFALGLMPFVWWSDARYGYFVSARQLIFIAPVVYILAGLGVAALATKLAAVERWSRAPAAAVAAVVLTAALAVGSWPGLERIYAGRFLPKEDWRAAAAYVARHICPSGRLYVNVGPLFSYGVGLYEPDLMARAVELEGTGLAEWVVDIMERHQITDADVVLIFRDRPGVFVAGRGDMQTVADYLWARGFKAHELFTPRLWAFRAERCPAG